MISLHYVIAMHNGRQPLLAIYAEGQLRLAMLSAYDLDPLDLVHGGVS